MTQLRLVCITMAGHEYALFDGGFPEGEPRDGEPIGDAARRLVDEWTGTQLPKLEIVDLLAAPGRLTFVMRALLITEPASTTRKLTRAKRMELPAKVGSLDGKYVEEALKTSSSYKLTRTS